MAEEKLNTGSEGAVLGSTEAETTIPVPETDGPPAPGGDVVVDADTIERLMAERRAAAREEVEQNELNTDAPGHEEQTEATNPPVPGEGAPALSDGDGPTLKADGTSAKVIDFTAAGGPDNRESEKKDQDKQDAEQEKKPRRSRTSKEKGGPKADKTDKPRKGRPAKAEKAAPEQGKAERDKVSQSKDGKEPGPPAADGGPGSAPTAETEASTTPRPIEDAKVVYLKLSELHPFHTFRQHPFKVVDDAAMKELSELIREQGVISPATVRPEKDGSGYEIIAGHRRHHSCELLGLEEIPCIVREMTDHEAVMEMKNSNKQRGDPLPSELARLLDLEVEDIKHQGGRLKNVAEGDIGKRSVEIVGEAHDMNYKKVMRYLRLNSLVPELLDKVDDKKMGFMPAVEISYIRPKNQRLIAVSIDGEQASPSLAQAKKLRELDKDGKLNGDVIDGILSEKKKEDRGVIISTAELEKYFGKEATPAKMKEQIMNLLDEWKEKQPPELAKAPKKMEQDK